MIAAANAAANINPAPAKQVFIRPPLPQQVAAPDMWLTLQRLAPTNPAAKPDMPVKTTPAMVCTQKPSARLTDCIARFLMFPAVRLIAANVWKNATICRDKKTLYPTANWGAPQGKKLTVAPDCVWPAGAKPVRPALPTLT